MKTTSFEVRSADINYGGHLGNEMALVYFQEARLKFLDALGYSETDIGEGKGIIMTEAHIQYKMEVFLHERLYAEVAAGESGRVFFDLDYRICRESDDEVVIEGSTRQLGFDYRKRKVVSLPEKFVREIGN